MSPAGKVSPDRTAPEPSPDVLALRVGRAREVLAAAGWRVGRLLTTQDSKPRIEASTPLGTSDPEGWRVIRQRAVGVREVELLAASEMHLEE